jgi:hypothetical protein
VLLQEHVQRQPEAAFGKTARVMVTCRATVGEQPGGRFALIDILRLRRSAGQHDNRAKGEEAEPRFPPQNQS